MELAIAFPIPRAPLYYYSRLLLCVSVFPTRGLPNGRLYSHVLHIAQGPIFIDSPNFSRVLFSLSLSAVSLLALARPGVGVRNFQGPPGYNVLVSRGCLLFWERNFCISDWCDGRLGVLVRGRARRVCFSERRRVSRAACHFVRWSFKETRCLTTARVRSCNVYDEAGVFLLIRVKKNALPA